MPVTAPDFATLQKLLQNAVSIQRPTSLEPREAPLLEGFDVWGGRADFTDEPFAGMTARLRFDGIRSDPENTAVTLHIELADETGRTTEQEYIVEVSRGQLRVPAHVQPLLDAQLQRIMAELPTRIQELTAQYAQIKAAEAQRISHAQERRQEVEEARQRLPEIIRQVLADSPLVLTQLNRMPVSQAVEVPGGGRVAVKPAAVEARMRLMRSGSLPMGASYYAGGRLIHDHSESIILGDGLSVHIGHHFQPLPKSGRSVSYARVAACQLVGTHGRATIYYDVAYGADGLLDFDRTAPYLLGQDPFTGPRVPEPLQRELRAHELAILYIDERVQLGHHDPITVVDRAIAERTLAIPPLAPVQSPTPVAQPRARPIQPPPPLG